jgi:hypothetical protein
MTHADDSTTVDSDERDASAPGPASFHPSLDEALPGPVQGGIASRPLSLRPAGR